MRGILQNTTAVLLKTVNVIKKKKKKVRETVTATGSSRKPVHRAKCIMVNHMRSWNEKTKKGH